MPKLIDSLYIHFPFCVHLCNYCDFYKKVPLNKAVEFKNYHDFLNKSYEIHQILMKKYGYSWGNLETLYIGGGTPSLWGKEGKIFLQNMLEANSIVLKKEVEFTLEVNPGAWTRECLNDWKELGVNRYSLGIQTLNPELISYLDRVHSIGDVYKTLEYFKDNKENFSMDFMLGLPFSEKYKRNVIQELEMALSFNPSHFSVYILTVKNNYTHYNDLPSEHWISEEYLIVSDFLKSKGFEHYEVSNFALPGKQSQHNLNYWKSKTVAALGPSATGFLSEEKIRYKWKTNFPEFEPETLTEDEFKLEEIYLALRSEIGISINSNKLNEIVLKWEQDGLAKVSHGKLFLTSSGYLVLDTLMNQLFASKII